MQYRERIFFSISMNTYLGWGLRGWVGQRLKSYCKWLNVRFDSKPFWSFVICKEFSIFFIGAGDTSWKKVEFVLSNAGLWRTIIYYVGLFVNLVK